MPFLAIATEDRRGRGANPIMPANRSSRELGDCRFGLRHRPGIGLSNHVQVVCQLRPPKPSWKKLDLVRRKLERAFSTARRIYQLPVSPCVNQPRHPSKCLVYRVSWRLVRIDL
jgi:hypothetical protein